MEARIEEESGKQFSWTTPPNGYNAVVTPVHNQQDICASCWAFVTADSVASRWAVLNGGQVPVEDMSVKQLMACDTQDNGCNTGNMYTAYDWIGDNGGLSSRRDYNDPKYVSAGPGDDDTATCRDDPDLRLALDTPAMCDIKMTGGNVALMEAVRGAGPIAIGINANNLQFYESGVINAASCPPGRGIQSINHAALLVGWGEENGVKYWLVKNSYGLDFGENGFFRLERARASPDTLFGTCGLLFESVYPVVIRAGDQADEGTLRSQCTEGSVFKQDYYRNEADNPGAAASAMAEAEAALSASLGKMSARGSRVGSGAVARERRQGCEPTVGGLNYVCGRGVARRRRRGRRGSRRRATRRRSSRARAGDDPAHPVNEERRSALHRQSFHTVVDFALNILSFAALRCVGQRRNAREMALPNNFAEGLMSFKQGIKDMKADIQPHRPRPTGG